MKTILIYDIPSDKVRAKVADICMDYGMARIQYSAFLGDLNANRQEELIQKLKRKIDKREADVQLFPLCDKDVKMRKVIHVKGNEDSEK